MDTANDKQGTSFCRVISYQSLENMGGVLVAGVTAVGGCRNDNLSATKREENSRCPILDVPAVASKLASARPRRSAPTAFPTSVETFKLRWEICHRKRLHSHHRSTLREVTSCCPGSKAKRSWRELKKYQTALRPRKTPPAGWVGRRREPFQL